MAASRRPPGPRPKTAVSLPRPTSGRILRYTLADDDHPNPGRRGSRPCIIVDSYGDPLDEAGEVYDVVVFTAGVRDFIRGREGCFGFLSKTGVRLVADSKQGAIHWPPVGRT